MQKQSIESFLGNYRNNDYSLFILSGDNYEIKKIIDTVKKDFTDDMIDVFFADDSEKMLEALKSRTLFGKRLLIMYNVDEINKNERKEIEEIVKYPSNIKPDSVILIYSKHPPEIKDALTGNFKPVYDSKIPGWIKKTVENYGFFITDKALELLHFSFGTNRQMIEEQLKRIISTKKDKKITVNDVRDLGFHRDNTVFKITDSVLSSDYRKALEYLSEISDIKPLVHLLNRDLRFLLVIKANMDLNDNIQKLASKKYLGLHRYFLNTKYKPAAKKQSFNKLKNKYILALNAEKKIKKGWNEFHANFNLINQLQMEDNYG